MAAPRRGAKPLRSVYRWRGILSRAGKTGMGWGGTRMIWLALAMFVALFGWGAQYFGWQDPIGKVQLALFTSFVLGVIVGYKNKG